MAKRKLNVNRSKAKAPKGQSRAGRRKLKISRNQPRAGRTKAKVSRGRPTGADRKAKALKGQASVGRRKANVSRGRAAGRGRKAKVKVPRVRRLPQERESALITSALERFARTGKRDITPSVARQLPKKTVRELRRILKSAVVVRTPSGKVKLQIKRRGKERPERLELRKVGGALAGKRRGKKVRAEESREKQPGKARKKTKLVRKRTAAKRTRVVGGSAKRRTRSSKGGGRGPGRKKG